MPTKDRSVVKQYATVVQAAQWNPVDIDGAGQIVAWLSAMGVEPQVHNESRKLSFNSDDKEGGRVYVEPGDWIIRDLANVFTVVGPFRFARARYREAL